MRKISMFLCMILTLVLFAGCGAKSVGMIGGADGPTNVYVQGSDGSASNGNNEQTGGSSAGDGYNSEIEPVRTIMVDGCLYYEIGEDRDITERPVALEAGFTKTVEAFETPKNNNEANFDVANADERGYRMRIGEDTLEVPIDNEWEIFKKLYDPEKDLSQYKYIVKIEGDTQYNLDDAEYIVLTNDINITANDVAKSLLSSQGGNALDIYIVNAEND